MTREILIIILIFSLVTMITTFLGVYLFFKTKVKPLWKTNTILKLKILLLVIEVMSIMTLVVVTVLKI